MTTQPDMSKKIMIDDTQLSLLESAAGNVYAIAAYLNGDYAAEWGEVVSKWGESGKYLLSIDVLNRPQDGAQCLDIENGDATVNDAPRWVEITQAAGKAARDFRWYPKLYTSVDNLPVLVSKLSNAGIARDEVMLWSAHYGAGEHICGPATCGSPVQADATQWTDNYLGVSLDASSCFGYFFAGPPTSPPPPPAPRQSTGRGLCYLGQLNLAWEAVTGPGARDRYEVQVQRLVGFQRWEMVAQKTTPLTYLTVRPLSPRTTFRWRVSNGTWSEWQKVQTP